MTLAKILLEPLDVFSVLFPVQLFVVLLPCPPTFSLPASKKKKKRHTKADVLDTEFNKTRISSCSFLDAWCDVIVLLERSAAL